MALGSEFFDERDVFFEALDFDVFLEHFDESLEDELFKEIAVESGVGDFLSECVFDVLLDFFDVLVSEFHFGHA